MAYRPSLFPPSGSGIFGRLPKLRALALQPVEAALLVVLVLGLVSILRGIASAYVDPGGGGEMAGGELVGDALGDARAEAAELRSSFEGTAGEAGEGDESAVARAARAGAPVSAERAAELKRLRRFDPGLIATAGDPLPQDGWEAALRDDECREDPPKRPFYWWFRYRTAQGGFPGGLEETHTGAAEGKPAISDNSCGGTGPPCSGHGYCARGKCHCAKSHTGLKCERSANLPGFGLPFSGSFVLSRDSLLRTGGIRFRTDPSDEPPPTKPYIRLPVSKEVWVAQPKRDIFEGKLYGTCAVVGASGVLRFYAYGSEIDSHDAVFRFNRAPTRRYEKFVGQRTTYRFESPLHAGFHEGNESNVMPMPTKSYLYLHTVYHRKHPYTKLYLLDVGINAYAATAVQALPSVGYLALVTALHRCASVTVYGFSWQQAFGVPHHYYNNEQPRRGQKSAYDYDAEQTHLRKLAKEGHVRLPEPCIAGCQKISGMPCTNCPPGSTCTCESRYPMPVALPGFCRVKGQFGCFYRCPGGAMQCPGGIRHTRCPKAMTPRILKDLGLQCTTAEDLRKNPAPALPGADVITDAEPTAESSGGGAGSGDAEGEDKPSRGEDGGDAGDGDGDGGTSPEPGDSVVESEFP